LQTTGATAGGVSVATAYGAVAASATGGANTSLSHTHSFSVTSGGVSANHTHNTTLSGQTASTGTGTAFTKITPTMVITMYMKL